MATLQELLGGGLPQGLLSPAEMKAAEQRAQNALLTNLGFALLQSSRGQPGQGKPSIGQVIGQAGPVGLQAYQQSFDKTLADTLKGMQVKDLLAKRADEESMRQAQRTFQSRLAGATTMQPTMQGVLNTQSNIDPAMLEGMSAQEVIGMAPKTQQVTDQAAADRAVMDYLRVASPVEYAKLVAKEPRALPSSVQEYQFAVSQGFKGTFADYQEQMNKSRATNINLPSEGERKAGFLANRVQFGLQQMADVIKTNAPAASPEKLPSLVKFLTQSDFLSNSLTSPDRQRIEAAQLDILDAALTLGTGAAYTREQLEGYRKAYFPQLNDDKTTIADKQKRLENLLESAYITAGRSAPTVGQRPSFSGQAAPSAPATPSGAPKGSLRSILFPDRK
jgi:hypothetical protein